MPLQQDIPKKPVPVEPPKPANALQQRIREFVHLESIARRYPPGAVPAQVQERLASLQAEYANLPPHLQQFANKQINDARIVQAEANTVQSRMQENARRLRGANRELQRRFRDTYGANRPLTAEQYAAIRNGAKTLTVKNSKARVDKQALVEVFKPHLKALGLSEKATFEQISDRLDDLATARQRQNAGERGAFSRALQNQNVTLDGKDLDSTLDWWNENALSLAWAERLAETDKSVPDSEDFAVTEDLRSRVNAAAPIIDAAMDAASEQDDFDEVASEFRQDTLEDEGMRGDIARAWLRTEAGDGVAAREDRGEWRNPLTEN